jgi:outer membrane protein TolC
VLVLLLVPSSVLAARPLSYEEAVAAALEHNPTLVGAELTEEQATDDVRSALGKYDPVFTFDGGWQRQQNVSSFAGTPSLSKTTGWNVGSQFSFLAPTGTTATVSGGLGYGTNEFRGLGSASSLFTNSFAGWTPNLRVQVSQNLLKGLLPSYNLQSVRQARERQSVAALQRDVVRQQAVADVARAYWSFVDADRTADIAHRAVSTAEEALRVGAAQVAEGRLAPVERTRLEAALVQARSSAIEADHAAAAAADALLQLMGEVPGQQVEPVSEVGEVPPLRLDVDAVLGSAFDQSPALAIARQNLSSAGASLRDAKHALWPTLSADVTGSYGGTVPTADYIENLNATKGESFTTNDFVVPSFNVGGTLSLPLGNRAALGAMRRAEAEVARREAELAKAESDLRAAVLAQVRTLESAALKVELADVNLRLARETLAAEEALQAVGRTVTKNVLEARTKAEEAEAAAVRARSDFRRAEVELRRLQGTLGDAG